MPRTAKVFMTNRSQAVRLPKEFQFSTDEVFIRFLSVSDINAGIGVHCRISKSSAHHATSIWAEVPPLSGRTAVNSSQPGDPA
jgi:hypothetical protein